MTAPLYDSLTAFSATNPLRMHMPGHKGIGSGLFSAIAQIDFTEIATTGNLYTGEGLLQRQSIFVLLTQVRRKPSFIPAGLHRESIPCS